MKPLSLRASLTLGFVGLTMAILGGFSATLYARLSRALHRGLDAQLQTRAQGLVELCDWDEDLGRPEFGQSEPAATPRRLEPGEGLEVWSWPQRKLLGSTGYALPKLAADAKFPDHPRPLLELATIDGEHRVRLCTLLAGVPAVQPSRDDPAKPSFEVLARVTESMAPIDAQLARVAFQIWTLVGVAALVVVAFGLWLSGRFVRPIVRLGNAAAAVRAGAPAPMPRRGSGDEVDRLAAILDATFGSLDDTLRRQQRFTANAAHELRNPITVIRNAADVALRNERSPAEYREFLADVLATSDRMSSILDALLTLARADAGVLRSSFHDVDLLEVARESAAAIAADRVVVSNGKPRVGSGAPSDGSDTQLRGDPRLLRVLADNLVANALRFSNGRPVEVAVLRDDPSHVTLTVRDHGPGVPEPDRARVFERFFRVEASQPKSNGAGLGLAIVAEIARLHAAECALEDAAPGARVRVRFPIA